MEDPSQSNDLLGIGSWADDELMMRFSLPSPSLPEDSAPRHASLLIDSLTTNCRADVTDETPTPAAMTIAAAPKNAQPWLEIREKLRSPTTEPGRLSEAGTIRNSTSELGASMLQEINKSRPMTGLQGDFSVRMLGLKPMWDMRDVPWHNQLGTGASNPSIIATWG